MQTQTTNLQQHPIAETWVKVSGTNITDMDLSKHSLDYLRNFKAIGYEVLMVNLSTILD